MKTTKGGRGAMENVAMMCVTWPVATVAMCVFICIQKGQEKENIACGKCLRPEVFTSTIFSKIETPGTLTLQGA